MNETLKQVAQDSRARETFDYYDSVLIGQNQSEKSDGWYEDWAALSAANEINFFNIRNRATSGVAYCNLDAEGQFPVGYLMDSIGVEFMCPTIQGQWTPGAGVWNPNAYPWTQWMDMLNQASLRLYIGQDEKFNAPVSTLPCGYGMQGRVAGVNNVIQFSANQAMGTVLNNGQPDRGNRREFPIPIEIPRTAIVRAVIEFSDIVRDNMSRMQAPGFLYGAVSGGQVPAILGVKVSIGGTRIVQLRNAQVRG